MHHSLVDQTTRMSSESTAMREPTPSGATTDNEQPPENPRTTQIMEDAERARIKRCADNLMAAVMVITGTTEVGSSEVAGYPKWARPTTDKAGFVTGIAASLRPGDEPNESFLDCEGMMRLLEMYLTGNYRIELAEHSLMLWMVAMVEMKDMRSAQTIMSIIRKYGDKMRFYPTPASTLAPYGPIMSLDTAFDTCLALDEKIGRIKGDPTLMSLINFSEIILPLKLELYELWRCTVSDGWPGQVYPEEWDIRAQNLLKRYQEVNFKYHPKYSLEYKGRKNGTLTMALALRTFITEGPKALTGSQLSRVRMALTSVENTASLNISRSVKVFRSVQTYFTERQRFDHFLKDIRQDHEECYDAIDDAMKKLGEVITSIPYNRPTIDEAMKVVVNCSENEKIQKHIRNQLSIISRQLDIYEMNVPMEEKFRMAYCKVPSTDEFQEARDTLSKFPEDEGVPIETLDEMKFPAPLRKMIYRCASASVDVLVERGIIPSSEVLAKNFRSLVAACGASSMPTPEMERLYALTYQAFSGGGVLLLDFRAQIKFHDLPIYPMITKYREKDEEVKAVTLREMARIIVRYFPATLPPNPTITTLADVIDKKVPLVKEIAPDIFMGSFSATFMKALRENVGKFGDLYSSYFGFDSGLVEEINQEALEHIRYMMGVSKIVAERIAPLQAERDSLTAEHDTLVKEKSMLIERLVSLAKIMDLKTTYAGDIYIEDEIKRCKESLARDPHMNPYHAKRTRDRIDRYTDILEEKRQIMMDGQTGGTVWEEFQRVKNMMKKRDEEINRKYNEIKRQTAFITYEERYRFSGVEDLSKYLPYFDGTSDPGAMNVAEKRVYESIQGKGLTRILKRRVGDEPPTLNNIKIHEVMYTGDLKREYAEAQERGETLPDRKFQMGTVIGDYGYPSQWGLPPGCSFDYSLPGVGRENYPSTSRNGKLIEQMQILTGHNFRWLIDQAYLTQEGLLESIRHAWDIVLGMTQSQMARENDWAHYKNIAYGWRQLVMLIDAYSDREVCFEILDEGLEKVRDVEMRERLADTFTRPLAKCTSEKVTPILGWVTGRCHPLMAALYPKEGE